MLFRKGMLNLGGLDFSMPMLDIKKMFEADKVLNPSSYLLNTTVLLYGMGLEESVPPSAGSKGSFSPNFIIYPKLQGSIPGFLWQPFRSYPAVVIMQINIHISLIFQTSREFFKFWKNPLSEIVNPQAC